MAKSVNSKDGEVFSTPKELCSTCGTVYSFPLNFTTETKCSNCGSQADARDIFHESVYLSYVNFNDRERVKGQTGQEEYLGPTNQMPFMTRRLFFKSLKEQFTHDVWLKDSVRSVAMVSYISTQYKHDQQMRGRQYFIFVLNADTEKLNIVDHGSKDLTSEDYMMGSPTVRAAILQQCMDELTSPSLKFVCYFSMSEAEPQERDA
ncbi:hypothetical protein HOLleu_31690 [Holothuria leucospilota]|uniref:Uncharacterized protein n=1 Tax=Holothuria leucospilota TaxID=206669 RepID=A0A9Q0YSF7_HOLLE|nr:hypothetical protein HOLleu_31690 [Holothuria leucospilota]